MPWVGFVYLMAHMLYSHLYRELYPQPGVFDITAAQMVMVMKVGGVENMNGIVTNRAPSTSLQHSAGLSMMGACLYRFVLVPGPFQGVSDNKE